MNASPLPGPEPVAEAAVERQLRNFFRAKLPDPFPPLVLPASEPLRPAPRSRRTLLTRSRIVMAVCVSLLLLSLWFLMRQNPADRLLPVRNIDDVTGKNTPIFPKHPSGTAVLPSQPAR